MALRFTILGPVAGQRDGTELALGGRRQRTAIAWLLLAQGRSVSVERMVEAVWGPDAPDTNVASLRVFLTNLRKAVGSPEWIHFDGHGYRLAAGHDLDLAEFEELRREARRAPLPVAGPLWRAAYDCFTGDPLTGIEETELVDRERTRLREARMAARDEALASALGAGRHADVVAELAGAVGEDPLRERLRGMLMVALYRDGRQADALRVYADGRERLIDELGLEPGPELRRIERLILEQSADLEWAPPAPVPAGAGVPTTVDARSAGVPLAVLAFVEGEDVVVARRVVVVGRAGDCDVVLDDERVSRRHAVLRWRNGGWEVLDDGSTNGTEVNGEPADLRRLADGDELSFGGVVARFRLP